MTEPITGNQTPSPQPHVDVSAQMDHNQIDEPRQGRWRRLWLLAALLLILLALTSYFTGHPGQDASAPSPTNPPDLGPKPPTVVVYPPPPTTNPPTSTQPSSQTSSPPTSTSGTGSSTGQTATTVPSQPSPLSQAADALALYVLGHQDLSTTGAEPGVTKLASTAEYSVPVPQNSGYLAAVAYSHASSGQTVEVLGWTAGSWAPLATLSPQLGSPSQPDNDPTYLTIPTPGTVSSGAYTTPGNTDFFLPVLQGSAHDGIVVSSSGGTWRIIPLIILGKKTQLIPGATAVANQVISTLGPLHYNTADAALTAG
jgi:hypothetical protein